MLSWSGIAWRVYEKFTWRGNEEVCRNEDLYFCQSILQLNNYYLFGFSLGVGMAIRAATLGGDKVLGLMLGDYPPKYPTYDKEWAARVKENSPELREVFVDGLSADSGYEDLFPELKALSCPSMLFKGGQVGNLVPEEVVTKYKEMIPSGKVVILADSGHVIFRPDPKVLTDEMEKFIKEVEIG